MQGEEYPNWFVSHVNQLGFMLNQDIMQRKQLYKTTTWSTEKSQGSIWASFSLIGLSEADPKK